MTQHEQNETDNPPCTDGFSAHHSSTLSLRRTDDAFLAANCPQRPAWLCTGRDETCCLFPGITAGGECASARLLGGRAVSSPGRECPSTHSFPTDPLHVLFAGLEGRLFCAGSVSSAQPRPLRALHERLVDINTDGEFQGGQDPQATMWRRNSPPAQPRSLACPPSSSNTDEHLCRNMPSKRTPSDTRGLCAL